MTWEGSRERGTVVGGRKEMKRARRMRWLVADDGGISWRERHCKDLNTQLMDQDKISLD